MRILEKSFLDNIKKIELEFINFEYFKSVRHLNTLRTYKNVSQEMELKEYNRTINNIQNFIDKNCDLDMNSVKNNIKETILIIRKSITNEKNFRRWAYENRLNKLLELKQSIINNTIK